ncbi:MAG: indole-3-glycerol-phosphate synthase TrpC, partial [Pseudomonadota bacterium]
NEELDRALKLDPDMIGVNNRNLKTLEVDLQNGIDMATNIPDNVLKVGESGIYSHDDLMRLKDHGFQAFLVGESLMRQDDIGLAVKNLLG